MDILELIEKRASLWHEAKTFLDDHTDKNGKISAEDAATYDRMEDEIVSLGKNIERFQRQAAVDLQMASPTTQPVLNTPAKFKSGLASDEYRQAALTAMRTNFRQVSNYLNESTDASGGYLVPTEWDSRLIKTLTEENVMRQLGKVITTSGEHKINIAATRPTAAWVDEGASLNFTDATFTQISLEAHKLQVGIKVTNELLYDNAFNLEDHILEEFGREIANAEEDAFLNGEASANNKPTGLFVTASSDTTTVVPTASASIGVDDVMNLVYALKRPYRKNAVFLLNDGTLAAIRKLKDSNGAYIWQPSYQAGEPERLLGYPVYSSAYAPTIAAGATVIAFGDMSYYNIADRGTRSFRELRELYAGNDQTGFLMIERVDGKLVLPEAVKVLKIKG